MDAFTGPLPRESTTFQAGIGAWHHEVPPPPTDPEQLERWIDDVGVRERLDDAAVALAPWGGWKQMALLGATRIRDLLGPPPRHLTRRRHRIGARGAVGNETDDSSAS